MSHLKFDPVSLKMSMVMVVLPEVGDFQTVLRLLSSDSTVCQTTQHIFFSSAIVNREPSLDSISLSYSVLTFEVWSVYTQARESHAWFLMFLLAEFAEESAIKLSQKLRHK